MRCNKRVEPQNGAHTTDETFKTAQHQRVQDSRVAYGLSLRMASSNVLYAYDDYKEFLFGEDNYIGLEASGLTGFHATTS